MEPLLQIHNLKTHFIHKNRRVRAVDGIDIDVAKGQILCIVGESGSGKSMTSLSIMKLVPEPNGRIVEGEIRFEGRDIVALSDKEMRSLRGNEISMIFQEPMTALNPSFTIGRQISEVLRLHKEVSRAQALQRTIEMLQVVGVPRAAEIVKEYPHQLSGGLRQRAMIAMSMICRPKLLIADEPTTALDVTIQAQVLDLMRHMQAEFSTAIMLITHDLGVVAEMAEHVVVMYAGQIVESADADTVFRNPEHPYTKGLMDCIPSLHEPVDRLYSIPGSVPDASAFPEGCRFYNRCPIAQASCQEGMPSLREVEAGHFVRCHFA